MDLKGYICLTVTKEERQYLFFVPQGAPYGEAYDCAFKALDKLSELSKEAADRVRPRDDKPAEVKAEPVA
jgi:hypothetical protein